MGWSFYSSKQLDEALESYIVSKSFRSEDEDSYNSPVLPDACLRMRFLERLVYALYGNEDA